MSEVVDSFPSSGRANYDWPSWIDGQIHKCTRGVDFDGPALRVARAAYKWAPDHGLTVRARVIGDCVWLQFSEAKPRRSVGRPRAMRLLRAS